MPGGYISRPAAQQAAAALQQSAMLPLAQGINSMYSQQPASHLPYVATAAPDLPYSRNPIMPSQASMQQSHSAGFSAHLSPAEQQYSKTPVTLRSSIYDQQQSSNSYGWQDSRQQQPPQRYMNPSVASPSGYGQDPSLLTRDYSQPASARPTAYGPSSGGQPQASRGYAASDGTTQRPGSVVQHPVERGYAVTEGSNQGSLPGSYPAPSASGTTGYIPDSAGAGSVPNAMPTAADAKKATYR